MSLQELSSRKNANMQEMMDGMSGLKYEEMQNKNEKLEAEYSRQIQRQVSLARDLSRISPAACMTYVTLSLADTGATRHERFLAEAKSYKPQFVEVVGSMMAGLDFQNMFINPKKPDTSGIPRFTFHEEQFGDAVSRARADFIITGILTVMFFVGAHLAFLRYDASR